MEHIGSARILLQAQRFPNLIDDLLWRARNVDSDRTVRLFKIGQLAGEDGLSRKVSMPSV